MYSNSITRRTLNRILRVLLTVTILWGYPQGTAFAAFDWLSGWATQGPRARQIPVDTTNFTTNLNSTHTDLQQVADALDDLALAGAFTGLSDTPSSFSGQALQFMRVNAGETAIEFVASPAGGSAITYDIGDDSGNDSTDLNEIATTGDPNNIFTEPSADKMLIDAGQNWPTADTANAGDSATAFFPGGTIEHERGGLEADVNAYDGLLGITGGATYNQTGTTTQIIIFDGAGAPTSAAISGDGTMTNAGVLSVVDDSHNHIYSNIDSTTSANWASQVSDETGTGAWVFGTAPTFVTSITMGAATLSEAELEILDGATITTAETETLSDGSNADALHVHAAAGVSGLGTADISGLDISDDTNLAVTAPITLTGDTVGVSAASTTATGVSELATAAETTTGTGTAVVITPDGLAGSDYGKRNVAVTVFEDATDATTGNAKRTFQLPDNLNGYNLVGVHAMVVTAGTTGTLDIQIHNITDAVDVLSTVITIDSTETGSDTAATAAVINAANDDVDSWDRWRIDIDAVHTTASKGLVVLLIFQLP